MAFLDIMLASPFQLRYLSSFLFRQLRFYGEIVLDPSLPSTFQNSDILVPEFYEPPRHTGAGILVLSRTVNDDSLILGVIASPGTHVVRVHPHSSGYLLVAFSPLFGKSCI